MQENMTSLVEDIMHGLILYMQKIRNPNMVNGMNLDKESNPVFFQL